MDPEQLELDGMQEEEQYQPSEMYNGFLQNVAEEDRDVVGRYLTDWDRNVNQQFESIHNDYRGKLSQYEEFGPAENVGEAVRLYQAFSEDPKKIFDVLQTYYGAETSAPAPVGEATLPEDDDYNSDLPPGIQEKLDQQEQLLTKVAQHIIATENFQEQQRLNQEYDAYMSSLEDQFKDQPFDRQFVEAMMAAGHDGFEVASEYANRINQQVQSRIPPPPAPKVMGGGGAIPTQPKIKLGEVSNKDLQAFVAQQLRGASS